jgi:hypothetical protein
MNQSKMVRLLGPVVTAALVAGVALLLTAMGRSSAGSAAPWLDQPVKIPVATPAHAGAPACAGTAVRVRPVRHGIVQDGAYAYVYSATNVSGNTCYVSGYPYVTIGRKVLSHGPDVLSVAAGDLRPRQAAMFALTQTTRPGCSAGASGNGVLKQAATAAVMSIGSARPRVTGEVLISKCTENSVTALGLPPAEPRADALSRLSVRLDMPATATAGQILKFQVVLSNPTRAPIRLSPCPGYEAGISAAGAHAYRLNCGNPLIAAGQSRVFEMEYAVPAGTRAGLAKIGWLLLNPRRTGSGTVITIIK